MFQAVAEHLRTGRRSIREVPSAENGAEQLFMLMRMDGWSEGHDETVGRLVAGEKLTHKLFSYSVTGENQ